MIRLIGLVVTVMLVVRVLSDRIVVVDVNGGANLLQDLGAYTLKGDQDAADRVRVPYSPSTGRVGETPAYGPYMERN